MCGRYTLRQIDLIRAGLGLELLPSYEEFTELKLVPRFNIAPSQLVPVVRLNNAGGRSLGLAKWGLIPSWSKSLPKVKPINARAESLATSRMFHDALARRRCLVPADGFYEWQGTQLPKQPYFIQRRDGGIFAFAGLWERWKPSPDEKPIDTVTIITTQANSTMEPIHARMPVILHERDFDRWLSRDVHSEQVMDLMRPFDGPLEAMPVSTRVNSAKNDGPELINGESAG